MGNDGLSWDVLILIAWLVYATVCAVACASIATQKNKEPMGYGILGFLFGIVGLLIIGFTPAGSATATKRPSWSSDEQTKKCPSCAEIIKLEAMKCRYCGRDFDSSEVAALLNERRSILQAAKQQEEAANPSHSPPATEWLPRGMLEMPYQGRGSRLCEAAFMNHLDVARGLLIQGADVNARDSDGDTALHIASSRGHPDMVSLLLGSGAKADLKNRWHETALMRAAARGHDRVAELLLVHAADPETSDNRRRTALMCAAVGGHGKVAEILLAHGADPETSDDRGRTALMCAVASGSTEVINVLFEHGGDASLRDAEKGRKALFLAVWTRHLEVARLLLRHGAPPKIGPIAWMLLWQIPCTPEAKAARSLRDELKAAKRKESASRRTAATGSLQHSEAAAALRPEVQAAPSEALSAVTIRCPQCSRPLQIPPEFMQVQGKCRHCGCRFVPQEAP